MRTTLDAAGPSYRARPLGAGLSDSCGLSWTTGILLRIRWLGAVHRREPGRARCVPVSRAAYGDSRSLTGQPTGHLTCAVAGPAGAATTFANRGSAATVVREPRWEPSRRTTFHRSERT